MLGLCLLFEELISWGVATQFHLGNIFQPSRGRSHRHWGELLVCQAVRRHRQEGQKWLKGHRFSWGEWLGMELWRFHQQRWEFHGHQEGKYS